LEIGEGGWEVESGPLIRRRESNVRHHRPLIGLPNHIPRIASVQCAGAGAGAGAQNPSCEQQFLERSRSSTMDEPWSLGIIAREVSVVG
jgi:hypothetical protein